MSIDLIDNTGRMSAGNGEMTILPPDMGKYPVIFMKAHKDKRESL